MAFIPLAFSRTLHAHTPLPPSRRRRGTIGARSEMVEDRPSRRSNARPNRKAYPQSALRLTAPSAEGAFWTALPAKPPLKGEAPAAGRRRGSFPRRRMVAAALSAAVTGMKLIGETPASRGAGGDQSKRKGAPRTPPALRERRFSPSPPAGSDSREVAAALSAAVDHNQAYWRAPHLSGGTNYAETTPPNATRSSGEGVWGRGASLREAASPPRNLPPTRPLFEREREGGGFSAKKPPPSQSSSLF